MPHGSSSYTNLISLLQCCKQLPEITQIHGSIIKTGFDSSPFILSKLLVSSIHHIQYTASIFSRIRNPNLFMFNTLLRAFSISDEPNQALVVFNNLRDDGDIGLDQFSFIATLKACARELAVANGRGIHGVAVKSGHVGFIGVRNTLMNFYSVCGKIGDARHLFDEFPERNDLVSWNTLMGGYVYASQPHVILGLFKEMHVGGFGVSEASVLHLLSAVGELGSFHGSECVHGFCIKMRFGDSLQVVTALIDVYARNGEIGLARRIFDGVVGKDVVSWNCMMDKYAKCGMVEEAVALLGLMRDERTRPNSSTLAGLLSACAASGSSTVGRFVIDYVEEERLALDAVLGTALVDMYAKCGFLDKALYIFEKIEKKDVKSWTAMISGFGAHGDARNALRLFYRMEEEGCRPNGVTFLAVLSACSHTGLVREGVCCFEMMVCKYGFIPKVEHYGCMIDLLGRAGLLEEAHRLIDRMPIKSDVLAWRTLLSACRVYGYVALGEDVQRVLAELHDDHPTNAMLLSGTYAIAGRLQDHKNVNNAVENQMAREENSVKEAGLSTIELDT